MSRQTALAHKQNIQKLNNLTSQLPLEEHGIVTALVELMKDVDPEEGICLLMLETLGSFMTAPNVDFSWLYTIGLDIGQNV